MALDISIPLRLKGGFDVELLRSKLEAHKRHLDAARASRERRHAPAVKKGIYVPRSAATHFTITTTPAVSDAATIVTRSFEPPRRPSLPAAVQTKADEPLIDEMVENQAADSRIDLYVGGEDYPPQKSLGEIVDSASLQSTGSKKTEEMESYSQKYHHLPGTAAKGQTVMASSSLSELLLLPSTHHKPPSSHPELRRSAKERLTNFGRRKPDDTAIDLRPVETVQRPHHPAMYNRPDWAQASQNGDESGRNLLHLPQPAIRELHPQSRKQHHHHHHHHHHREQHLVADAVKIIQNEQKLNRRKSIMGFFNKKR